MIYFITQTKSEKTYLSLFIFIWRVRTKIFRLKKTRANIINPVGSISLFYANKLIKKEIKKK